MAKTRKIKAFTLIELLVVISIIALLLSILMPSLGKVKEMAKKVVCASNFKQIGVVQSLYAVDWNSWIPRFRQKRYFFNTSGNRDIKPNGEGPCAAWCNVMERGVFEYVRESYGIADKFWMCPSLSRNYDYKNNYDGSNLIPAGSSSSVWPDAYWDLGVAYLIKVSDTESAVKVTDRGSKLLAADVTFMYDRDWENPNSRIAHKRRGSDETPVEGANRLHADGSVEWATYKTMALDNLGKVIELRKSINGPFPPGKNTSKWPGRDWYW